MAKRQEGGKMKALRKCRTCGLEAKTEEDLTLFRVSAKSKFSRDNHCKDCHRSEGRDYWKTGNGRDKRLKKYGITAEEYNKMFKKQKGRCKICGIHPTEMTDTKEFLSVDHCHTTGEVRGLLCDSCNLGLGKFYDNIELLENAITYLSSGMIESVGRTKKKVN